MRDAVGNHIDVASSAGRSSFVPLLVQAYRDMRGQTEEYNKVLAITTGCQDDFAAKQRVVLDKIAQFDRFKSASLSGRLFAGRFPDDGLRVTLPGLNLSGAAALEQIRRPIVEAQTSEAYRTDEQSSAGPVPTQVPSPAPSR